jgi:zinc transport system substrate-binding protein
MFVKITRSLSLLLLIYVGVAQAELTAKSMAKPVILSSIKPLTLIVQEIAGENAIADTLLPTTASPHDYPLKVSDYTRLKKADLVLWVGAELESFLKKPLGNLPATRVITTYQLDGLHWPSAERDTHHHLHERDPHLWLDPCNAVIVAKAVSEKLSQIDAAHQKIYDANLQVFTTNMAALDAKLLKDLKPLAGLGFVVYHEGYSHFVSRYGLHQLGYLALTPEQHSGAKHLTQVHEKLAKEGKCIFSEPYFDSSVVRKLAQASNLKIGVLDALGSERVKNYSQLLMEMAQAFSGCLLTERGNASVDIKK